MDFVEVLTERVSACHALVAVIGAGWVTSAGRDNRRRIDDPHDFVRIEIEAALDRGIRVIPVLVDGAVMPRSEDLPDSLKKLARRQGIEISDIRFDADVKQLTRTLAQLAEERRAEEERRAQEAAKAERVAREERERQEAAEAANAEGARRQVEAEAAERRAKEAAEAERAAREEPQRQVVADAAPRTGKELRAREDEERARQEATEAARIEEARKSARRKPHVRQRPSAERGNPRRLSARPASNKNDK